MAKYVVEHTLAGPFPKGREITDADITKAGHSVEHWMKHGAIKRLDGAQPVATPTRPLPVGVGVTNALPPTTSASHPREDQQNAEADRALKDAKPNGTTGNNADPARVPSTGGPAGK